MSTPTLYKVLVDGRSCHGGRLVWSLPTRNDDGTWTPGAWHEVDGDLALCRNGLHLTDHPAMWWLDGAVAFEVEAEGVVGNPNNTNDRKVVAKRVRLLRPVDPSGFLDAEETARLKEEIRDAKAKAERDAATIVDKARARASAIFSEAHDRAAERQRQKERAETARIIALTPAQRQKEVASGKIDTSAVLDMAKLAYANCRASRAKITKSVWTVLKLAVDTGMRFSVSDVTDAIHPRDVDIGHDALENLYASATEANHDSACASIESYLGRKPWVWGGKRLARGSKLTWEGMGVEVTSFDDDKDVLRACAYKHVRREREIGGRKWVDHDKELTRRFTIAREAFIAARKAAKKPAAKGAAR
jgi:hypothetical protein